MGKGKRFLPGAGRVVQQLAGGWQLNTITTLENGTPLIVRGANNFTGINWPDAVRDPALAGDQRSVTRWFDTEAIRNPADWVLGNIARTLPNTRGPGLIDISLSVFKNFEIREGMNLELRGEAFNAVNLVNYNNPNTTFSPNQQGVNTNALFGRITSSLAARRIQLGIRLAF